MLDKLKNFLNRDSKGGNSSEKSVTLNSIKSGKESNNLNEEVNNSLEELSQKPETQKVVNNNKKEQDIKKELEDVLTSKSIDKLKYLCIEISKIYLGVIPEIEVDDNYLRIIFDNKILSASLKEIVLNILHKYQDKGVILGYSTEQISLANGKVKISFSESSRSFGIIFNINKDKLSKEELWLIKNIIENEIFTKIVNIEEQKITSRDLIEFTNNFNDKVVFEEIDGVYYLRILESINISDFMNIAHNLIHRNSKVYIKIQPYGIDPEIYQIELVYIRSRSNIEEIRFLVALRSDKINFKISDFPRDVWEIFLKPFLEQLIDFLEKKKSKKVEDYINDLLNIGLIVDLPEKIEYKLDELLERYGFVGYEDLKEEILTNIIKPRKEKDAYLKFADENVPHIGSEILPNAVLFWGPPGTGKTTMSRIIGQYLQYPFIYLPVQSIMSKWYGESERILNGIFKRIEKIGQHYGGVILMIDEIDEIGRDRNTSHEATARLTGILLRKLDGLEKVDNVLLIGATNRKDGLDPALLSRFGEQFYFRYPNAKEIKAIFSYYLPFAEKLEEEFFKKFERKITGRDIKAICKKVARKMLKEGKETIDEQELKKLIEEYLKRDGV